MPTTSDIRDIPLIDARGRRAGRVAHVLFHPSEPRVVGFEIEPPAIAYVVTRSPRYVPLDQVEIAEESMSYFSAKPVLGGAAEKVQGFSWDDTVVWSSMPVLSQSGRQLGFVRDVRFSEDDGTVQEIALTGGATADVAIGTQRFAGELAVGFDPQLIAVIVRDEAHAVELSGGVAAVSGRTAAVAKVAAERAARGATKGATAAVKAAAQSEVAKRAAKGARSGWRAFKDGFDEGIRDEDD
ncbi:MAG: hypothetical protein U1E29_17455 [Coriobacteriia bacterium]|nr:hypothetical protein [Coriobacteriia bacterium]